MIAFLLFLVLLGVINIITVLYSILGRMDRYLHELEFTKEVDYLKEIEKPKNRKPPLKALKQTKRGRSVTKTDDLVDIADLDWEDGYKAIEDMGR